MSKLPYHRRNHREFLNGGKLLDNELYGAYSRICDLIYDNEGPIDDDAVWIAGVMRCSTRRYRTIRDTLIEHGKIEIVSGKIHNKRCKKELEFLSNFSRTQAERASNTDRKSREKKASSAKINGLTEAAAQPTETYTETEKKESPSLRSGDSLLLETRPRATPDRNADRVLDAVNHPLLDPAKAAGLISSAFEVSRWVAAGADLERVVIPTIGAAMARWAAKGRAPVKSWRLFTDEIHEATARFRAPNPTIQPIETAHVERHSHPRRASAAEREEAAVAARRRGFARAIVDVELGRSGFAGGVGGAGETRSDQGPMRPALELVASRECG